MKHKIETFKRLWAIPRYKAIIKLILWISFFFIIYLVMFVLSLINGSYEKKQVKPTLVTKTALESYTEMANYEYKYNFTYTFNNENKTTLIEGTKYNNSNSFKLASNKYKIENNAIYDLNNSVVTNLTDYDIILLEPSNIINLLKTAKNKEETKYNNGNIKTEYSFDDMLITTYEENHYITKIDLDLTNYMIKVNPKITSYIINIIYENINNIDSFNEL